MAVTPVDKPHVEEFRRLCQRSHVIVSNLCLAQCRWSTGDSFPLTGTFGSQRHSPVSQTWPRSRGTDSRSWNQSRNGWYSNNFTLELTLRALEKDLLASRTTFVHYGRTWGRHWGDFPALQLLETIDAGRHSRLKQVTTVEERQQGRRNKRRTTESPTKSSLLYNSVIIQLLLSYYKDNAQWQWEFCAHSKLTFQLLLCLRLTVVPPTD